MKPCKFLDVLLSILYILYLFFAEVNFKLSTNTACSTDGINKFISGFQKEISSQEDCKLECERHEWCKGYRVNGTDSVSCRLLTNENVTISDGWKHFDDGNWAEPDEWKETPDAVGYLCYEKTFVGKKHLNYVENI